MSFTLSIPKNTVSAVQAPKSAGLVTTAGTLYRLSYTTGLLEVAAADTTTQNKLYVVDETIAVADARTSAHALEVEIGDKFKASSVNNSNSTHNGQRMILNAAGTAVNNTGTDSASGVFVQIGVIGAAADKLVLVEKIS